MDSLTSYLDRLTFIRLCVPRIALIGTIPNEPILSEGTRTPLHFILVLIVGSTTYWDSMVHVYDNCVR
jgi:hypothetical protein